MPSVCTIELAKLFEPYADQLPNVTKTDTSVMSGSRSQYALSLLSISVGGVGLPGRSLRTIFGARIPYPYEDNLEETTS